MLIGKTLLARCKSNDPESQRALYDMFRPRVFGLCRRYTQCKEEAEDVFQDTFIRIFEKIGQLHDAEHLEQWITRIAVNTAVKYYHKNKRHQNQRAIEDNSLDFPNDDYPVILSHFSDEQLIAMINELPDGYRLVFNLYEVEGYSHAEIAELLNISAATSRSQLNRAKQTLKARLRSLGVLRYEKYA